MGQPRRGHRAGRARRSPDRQRPQRLDRQRPKRVANIPIPCQGTLPDWANRVLTTESLGLSRSAMVPSCPSPGAGRWSSPRSPCLRPFCAFPQDAWLGRALDGLRANVRPRALRRRRSRVVCGQTGSGPARRPSCAQGSLVADDHRGQALRRRVAMTGDHDGLVVDPTAPLSEDYRHAVDVQDVPVGGRHHARREEPVAQSDSGPRNGRMLPPGLP